MHMTNAYHCGTTATIKMRSMWIVPRKPFHKMCEWSPVISHILSWWPVLHTPVFEWNLTHFTHRRLTFKVNFCVEAQHLNQACAELLGAMWDVEAQVHLLCSLWPQPAPRNFLGSCALQNSGHCRRTSPTDQMLGQPSQGARPVAGERGMERTYTTPAFSELHGY